jgi:hypothetical protein
VIIIMVDRLTLSTQEVADLLGYSKRHFLRIRQRLHHDNGMPLPLVHLRWDAEQFHRWRLRPADAMEIGAPPEPRHLTDADRQDAAERNIERLARQHREVRQRT